MPWRRIRLAPAYDADWQEPPPVAADGFRRIAARHSPHRLARARAIASTTNARRMTCCCRRPRIARGLVTQRAMARIHRRRRLCDPGAVALRRLGDGRGRRLARAGLLGGARRRLVHHDARRPQAARSGRRGPPCQLLRGRRLCALGRQGSADRSAMGGRGRRRPARRRLRHASGNGPAAPIRPIRAIGRRRARSASTTASS